MDDFRLSAMELDALKEMGNVTIGNAATSLSKLINKSVDMNLPESKFVPVTKFVDEFGGPDMIVSSIYLKLEGDLTGESIFLFTREGAIELVDIMMGRPHDPKRIMDEMDMSAFKEMANVLTGTFLSSLSKMLDTKILPSIPHVATDMIQSILDFILVTVSEHADDIFLVRTKINVEGHGINADFLVLFDQPSLNKMIERMHSIYGISS